MHIILCETDEHISSLLGVKINNVHHLAMEYRPVVSRPCSVTLVSNDPACPGNRKDMALSSTPFLRVTRRCMLHIRATAGLEYRVTQLYNTDILYDILQNRFAESLL